MKLATKYLGKTILLVMPDKSEICGRVVRITCEDAIKGEPMAIFSMNRRRYEVDVNYLLENAVICTKDNGNTH